MAETEDVTYRINPEVDVDKYIIDCYELFGKVIGKAIFERIPLQFYLDRPLIKRILNKEVTIQDMYYFDKELYNTYSFILREQIKEEEFIDNFVVYEKKK